MKIGIGSDHGGVDLKKHVAGYLSARGVDVVDFGTDSPESVDYPDFGEKVAVAVAKGEVDAGIVFCGTGIGISIAANKIPGIRAALVTDPYMARMAKQHNDANVLALGGRIITPEQACSMVEAWLDASFEGGRHQRRLDKITQLERKFTRAV